MNWKPRIQVPLARAGGDVLLLACFQLPLTFLRCSELDLWMQQGENVKAAEKSQPLSETLRKKLFMWKSRPRDSRAWTWAGVQAVLVFWKRDLELFETLWERGEGEGEEGRCDCRNLYLDFHGPPKPPWGWKEQESKTYDKDHMTRILTEGSQPSTHLESLCELPNLSYLSEPCL